MNKNTILKHLEEKLSPIVKTLENGNATEHDIFPALLWLLLENSKELEKSGEITKTELLERIGNLKQVSAEDVQTIVSQENQKTLSYLLEGNKYIEKLFTASANSLQERIDNLKQISPAEVEAILVKENQKMLSYLVETSRRMEKSVGALDATIIEHTKNLIVQENQKTYSLLKWLIGLCVVQFIGLGALAAIIWTR